MAPVDVLLDSGQAKMAAMSIYKVLRRTERFGASFRAGDSGVDSDHVSRQAAGSYIGEFARGTKQGAVGARSAQNLRQPRTSRIVGSGFISLERHFSRGRQDQTMSALRTEAPYPRDVSVQLDLRHSKTERQDQS